MNNLIKLFVLVVNLITGIYLLSVVDLYQVKMAIGFSIVNFLSAAGIGYIIYIESKGDQHEQY